MLKLLSKLPVTEYGFKKSSRLCYSDDIYKFKGYLEQIIIKENIKHIFMYGNVLIPHKQALKLCEELNQKGYIINSHIFELGYLRPNFVTLENKGVNYDSGFINNRSFYEKQKPYERFPVPIKHGLRISNMEVIFFLQP